MTKAASSFLQSFSAKRVSTDNKEEVFLIPNKEQKHAHSVRSSILEKNTQPQLFRRFVRSIYVKRFWPAKLLFQLGLLDPSTSEMKRQTAVGSWRVYFNRISYLPPIR